MAFRPNTGDRNGISVVRKKHTLTHLDALVGVDQEKYHLALLPVAFFESLELTVVEAWRANCVGHAVVPKLNTANNEVKELKADLKEKMRLLAIEAAKNMIILPLAEVA